MTLIEISDDTNRRLLRLARSFNDSADDVIRRLLNQVEQLDDGTDTPPVARTSTRRAPPGSILSEGEYWLPLLATLEAAGGELPASDAIEGVGRRLRGRFNARDYESLDQGGVRWKNRVRFARLRLKERGLLDPRAPRGVWRITDEGRSYLASAQ
jgi:Mrr N-terminal domain